LTYEKAHVDSINDVKFSHGKDGNLFISTSDDAYFKIWDLRKGFDSVFNFKAAEDSLCVG